MRLHPAVEFALVTFGFLLALLALAGIAFNIADAPDRALERLWCWIVRREVLVAGIVSGFFTLIGGAAAYFGIQKQIKIQEKNVYRKELAAIAVADNIFFKCFTQVGIFYVNADYCNNNFISYVQHIHDDAEKCINDINTIINKYNPAIISDINGTTRNDVDDTYMEINIFIEKIRPLSNKNIAVSRKNIQDYIKCCNDFMDAYKEKTKSIDARKQHIERMIDHE